MNSRLNPYLAFGGTAREAMEFYESVFGGKLQLSTYRENEMAHDRSTADHIMHSVLEAENGMVLMAGDAPSSVPPGEASNVSLSLSGDNEAELTAYFEKLAAEGSIDEPLVKAPWGDTFGMLTDRFGIHWMVNISLPPA